MNVLPALSLMTIYAHIMSYSSLVSNCFICMTSKVYKVLLKLPFYNNKQYTKQQ